MVTPGAVRLLNLGPTNWLRTQSVYRSTAALAAADSPAAIIVSTPLHAYAAVGGGHAPEDVIDLAACARLDVPVVRSPLNQPLTLLDQGALIVQGVFYRADAASLTRTLLGGMQAGLAALGVTHGEIADRGITARGRTLVETQSGQIGEAAVIQCALFIAPPGHVLSELAPNPGSTCLWGELPRPASPEMIQTALLEALSQAFDRPIERDRPRETETSLSKQIDLELLEEAAALLRTEVIHDAHD